MKLRASIKKLLYVAAAVVILFAVLSLFLRWFLTDIDDYRDEIVATLEDTIGTQIKIGRLQGRMYGFNPAIEIDDLRLILPTDQSGGIAVTKAVVEIDGLGSLINMAPVVESVYLSRARIRAMMDDENNLLLPDVGFTMPIKTLLAAFSVDTGRDARQQYPQIHIDDLDVEWKSSHYPQTLHFKDINLVIDQKNRGSHVVLDADLPEYFGKHIHFSISDGAVYMRGDFLNLDNVFAEIGGISPVSGTLSTGLVWQVDEMSHKLGIFDLQLDSSMLSLKGAKIGLVQHKVSDERFHTVLDVNLGKDAHIAPEWMQALQDMVREYTGSKVAIEIGMIEEAKGIVKFEHREGWSIGSDMLSSSFPPISLKDIHITDFESDVALNQLTLKKDNRWLEVDREFDRVILRANLDESQSSAVLNINNLELHVGEAMLKGIARFEGEDMSRVTTQLRLENMPTNDAISWLPSDTKIFSAMQATLPEIFRGGRIKNAEVRFAGAFTRHSEILKDRLHIRAEVEGLDMTYSEKQPPLRDMDAVVTLDDKTFEARLSKFKFLNATGRDTRVIISDITNPYLEVQSVIRAPFQDVFSYLKTLRGLFSEGKVFDGVVAKGDVQATLDLSRGLVKSADKKNRFNLALDLDENGLVFSDSFPQIDDIQGSIVIANDDARAEKISATLAGHPIAISAYVQDGNLIFSADAKLLPASVLAELTPVPSELLDGASDWRGEFVLSSLYAPKKTRNRAISFNATSNLRGMTLYLPHPFNKPSDQTVNFRFASDVGKPGGYSRITYGKLVQFDFLNRLDPLAGVLRFSPQLDHAMPLVSPGDFGVRGVIEDMSIDEWRKWWDKHHALFINKEGDVADLLDDIDVTIKHITFGASDFEELRINTDLDSKDRLVMNIESDPIAGKVILPSVKGSRIYVNMQRLHMDEGMVSTTPTEGTIDPEEIVPLAVKIRSFHFGSIQLDNLQMLVNRDKNGVDISSLRFEHIHKDKSIMQARLDGSWIKKETDHSRFKFDIKGSDYGRLLRNWGYSTSLRDGKGKINGELEWNAPAYAIDIGKVDGTVSISMKDGRIKAIEVGAGKLLGLLNIGAIARRFTLDFKDVFNEGFSFDRFKGTVEFKKGNMLTDKVVIKGPSLGMVISGRTGIVTRDYNQTIDVVPDFSANIPLATALLGGPIAGAVVFLAGKVTDIGDKINEAIVMRYTLKGSWEDPQVDFIEAPKINRLNPGDKLKDLFEGVGENIKKIIPGSTKDKKAK